MQVKEINTRAAIEQIKRGDFRQAAVLSNMEKEWDVYSKIAPDALVDAFSL